VHTCPTIIFESFENWDLLVVTHKLVSKKLIVFTHRPMSLNSCYE
jgi:hypothetical protein